ncbi:MAG: biopolymer transporter ExbD [Opitutales bacterium]|nr:biopolymer transporter ExbD [Opitutales bacterium]
MENLESSRRRRRKFEVNIVPMVDVMTVLIFFFLLTMQFKDSRAIEINPPQMATSEAAKEQKKAAVVAVSKDGEFFFGDERVSIEKLSEKLRELAKSDEASEVVLLGDELAKYGDVAAAIDAARSAKIKKLSVRAAPKK